MMDGGKRVSFDLPYSDRANVNGKRLLEIYKDEKQSRGTKNVSMFKIAWKFCKSRVIVASIFWTLSIVLSLLSPVIFLKSTLEALDVEEFRNVTSDEGKINNSKTLKNYLNTFSHIIASITTLNSTFQIIPIKIQFLRSIWCCLSHECIYRLPFGCKNSR